MLSVAQLKLVSIESNFYQRSQSIHSDSIFVENDIKRVKFYEIDFLINKCEIARRELKYLIRWKEYDSAYDEWWNISEFEDVMNLIKDYELVMQDIIFLFDRLILLFISQQKFSFIVSFIMRLRLSFASSKQKKFAISIEKKISIDKSRLSKTNQKIMISWKSFTTQSFSVSTFRTTISIEQKFVVVISFRKLYIDAFKIRSIDWLTRRWWSRSSSIEIYLHTKSILTTDLEVTNIDLKIKKILIWLEIFLLRHDIDIDMIIEATKTSLTCFYWDRLLEVGAAVVVVDFVEAKVVCFCFTS